MYIDRKKNKVCNKCRDLINEERESKKIPSVTKVPKPVKQKPTVISNSYICPKCGSRLIIRNGMYGSFIGCTSYPRCKYTRRIS